MINKRKKTALQLKPASILHDHHLTEKQLNKLLLHCLSQMLICLHRNSHGNLETMSPPTTKVMSLVIWKTENKCPVIHAFYACLTLTKTTKEDYFLPFFEHI